MARYSDNRLTCNRWLRSAAPAIGRYAAAAVLARFPLNAILPAQDGPRAEAFYRDVLGLEQLSPPGADPMAFRAGGAVLVLTELPDRVPPDFPVVAFLVERIDDVVLGLAEHGVEFVPPAGRSFGGVEGRLEGHVVDFGPVRSTWLRDSEGNLLALNELTSAAP
jgi:catechol 2,3-dioxygenase-like lactoylglutathione lyase family enzyme